MQAQAHICSLLDGFPQTSLSLEDIALCVCMCAHACVVCGVCTHLFWGGRCAHVCGGQGSMSAVSRAFPPGCCDSVSWAVFSSASPGPGLQLHSYTWLCIRSAVLMLAWQPLYPLSQLLSPQTWVLNTETYPHKVTRVAPGRLPLFSRNSSPVHCGSLKLWNLYSYSGFGKMADKGKW